MKIKEIQEKVTAFFQESFQKEPKILGIKKMPDKSWKAEAEVYEESSFIKALGLPSRVMDRHVYEITLDDDLEIIGYKRIDDHQENESEN